MKRRDFLKLSGAAGASVSSGLLARRAHAAPFGEFPTSAASLLLPPERRATQVLEIFLYGGLSCWESLYLVDDYGQPTDPQYPNQQFYTFSGTGPDSVSAARSACGIAPQEPNGVDFATDSLGKTVALGPFALPLRNRADLVARMRLIVQRHNLEPHEAAVPLALTGKPVGHPSLAGLGSHIQRYFLDRDTTGRKSPFSYVFATGGLPGDNVAAAAATGLHPGIVRPLMIKVDNAARLYELLERGALGTAQDRARYDALVAVHGELFRRRLRFDGRGDALRSRRFSNLSQAASAVANADSVASVLDPSLFLAQPATVCGDSKSSGNIPAMSLKTAAHLLTHPTEPARYVCVSDTGLYEASGGGGYDTHTDNSHDTARNLVNVLQELAAVVNEPGELDPDKIDLDRTLIVLNTEFGRTPTRQGGGNGRNHHPYGYVSALIGGPIGEAQKGIHGAIGPDGRASTWMTPAEARIAALLAMGIWPFSPEAFFVSDVQGVSTEPDAAASVLDRALGGL